MENNKTNEKTVLSLIICCCLLCGACADDGPQAEPLTEAELAYCGVSPGSTTAEQMIEMWGEPDSYIEEEHWAFYYYLDQGCDCIAYLNDSSQTIWQILIHSGKEEISRGIALGADLNTILEQLPQESGATVTAEYETAVTAAGGTVYPIYGDMGTSDTYCVLVTKENSSQLLISAGEQLEMYLEFDQDDQLYSISLIDQSYTVSSGANN